MTSKAELKQAFRTFDIDGSGTLTAEEFLNVLTRGESEFTEEDAMDLINEFDTNGDGELDMDEFIAAMTAVSSFDDDGPDEDGDESGGDDDEDNGDDDDDKEEPEAAAPPPAKPSGGDSGGGGGGTYAEWCDPRGPVNVRLHVHPNHSDLMAYTVMPGGEGPPPGLRKKGFNKIKFFVDADGEACLEGYCIPPRAGHAEQDDAINLVFPDTDPARFKAAQAVRDVCKKVGGGVDCDMGLYLNTDGFGGMPSTWKMKNFSNPRLKEAGPAGFCRNCKPQGDSWACWQCGKPKSSHQVKMCAKCRGGDGAGKCGKCGGPGASGTLKTCSSHANKTCVFCNGSL